jgi:hypothetical protein
VDRVAVQCGDHGEGRRRRRGDEEPGGQQEVEAAAFDGVPDPCEQRDHAGGERCDRLQHQAQVRQVDLGLEAPVRHEQRQRRPEQRDEEDLSPEPGLEIVLVVVPHVHSCRQNPGGR